MVKGEKKGILNAGLKALLAGAEVSPWLKIPVTFVSELAALPEDEQNKLGELSQDEFNTWLSGSGVATARGVKEVKGLVQEIIAKLDDGFRLSRGRNHNLPYVSIEELFTGREEILEDLRGQAAGEKATAITQAIAGLGGIGKSRLAVEFAWWGLNNKKYGYVFFVSSETPKLTNASLAHLATGVLRIAETKVKEAEARQTALAWLSQNDSWLMIIDNADSKKAAEAVENLLPQLSRGQVIITSRYTRWSGAVQPRKLGLFKPDEAKRFLLERTKGRRTETDADEELAEKFVVESGYLPLLLEQAGAYIAHNGCSLAEYLEEWEAEREKVLGWCNEQEMQYDAAVATTYERTFERLSVGAKALLRLAAMLGPGVIPTAMFEKGSDTAGEAMKVIDEGTEPEFDCREATGELAAYSMITREEGGFAVHRIVQEVVRGRIAEGQRKDWMEAALWIVNDYTPNESNDVRTWPIMDVIRPHAEVIAQTADEAEISEPTSRLMSVLGEYLRAKGLYDDAEYWTRRTLEIQEESRGPDDPIVAICLNNLAQLLKDTNRLDEAEPLMRRALEIDEASFGPEHPDVAIDLNNLAGLLKDTNRLNEAEPLMRRALEIDEASFGSEHPNVARDLNNLAQLLKATNRLNEAEPLYKQIVDIVEKSLGKDHPKVAVVLNNLAQLLQDTNRLNEAEPLMRRALKIDEASFGPEHPDVARDLNNLAVLLQDTNRLDEAEPLYKRVVDIFEKFLGKDHPKVATALNNLAGLLQDTNRLNEAEPLYRRAVKIFEDSLGAGHPNTQTVKSNLEGLLEEKRR
ncbi:MAG: tetratricopeptide repeat protein [Planctomycetota bacterium]|jgi:tetratricopeptide (TPR) repeat protein